MPKKERLEHDAYYTDPKLANYLVELLITEEGVSLPRITLEPSCGKGAFARAIQDYTSVLILNDIQDQREHLADILDNQYSITSYFRQGDFKTYTPTDQADLILGNPPYNEAEAHVRHALEIVETNGTVAFLLRLAFLESQERKAFWKEFPPEAVYVLSKRPSFTGGGTDNAAYGFFIWRKWINRKALTRLRVVDGV